jgi:TRAP-type mannitol/chloroaromatic compound transport system substrate-binding protein
MRLFRKEFPKGGEPMDRRAFLTTTGAAAAAASTASAAAAATETRNVAAPAVAKGLRELRLATTWPDAVSGPADQAHRLAQRIATMSDGRHRIVIVPGAANGLAAVLAGEADLYHGSEHDHLDQHRALAYFAGLPGDRGIAARHLITWMLVGGGQSLWDELAGEFEVKAILAGHSGDESAFCTTRHIATMDELAGEKVSVTGLARDVVRGFGLEPVAVAPADLPGALLRGDILAAEWGGALTSHSLGLTAAAPHAVGTSINRHGAALSLGMRRSLWEGLGTADQAMFAAAAAAELQLALAEDEAHRRLLSPQGTVAPAWPSTPDLDRAVGRVADAVVAHVAASDSHAQRINAAYTAFRCMVLGDDEATRA